MARINIYTQQITVGQDDIDMQHRVSNLRYMAWMQGCGCCAFRRLRLAYGAIRQHWSGLGGAPAHHHLQTPGLSG